LGSLRTPVPNIALMELRMIVADSHSCKPYCTARLRSRFMESLHLEETAASRQSMLHERFERLRHGYLAAGAGQPHRPLDLRL